MTFTAIINHTFFLLGEQEGIASHPAEIKKDAVLHGEIFREIIVRHSHIIILKLQHPIDGYRFAKLDRWNFSID